MNDEKLSPAPDVNMGVMFTLALLITAQQIQPPSGFKVGKPSLDPTFIDSEMFIVATKSGKLEVRSYGGGPKRRQSKEKATVEPIEIKLGGVRQYVQPGYGYSFLDGELFSADAGEFGGGLTFIKKGSRTPERVLRENVKAFGVVKDKIYVLTGLAHLGIEETSIFEVSRKDKWEVKGLAKPEFVPPQAC